ncbi:hypothetical protein ACWIUH_05615 [Ursidibacter arcticus]
MSKVNINKIRILELPHKQFQGEAYYEGVLIASTIKYLNKSNCIKMLNRKIEEYNTINGKKIPLMKADGKEILYGFSKSNAVIVETSVAQETTNTADPVTDPVKTKAKTQKPKRKPFTPYGLNGYLVDKQGNVRLMLDRRANASTIVLVPEMFSALADMVRKTQEQQNA